MWDEFYKGLFAFLFGAVSSFLGSLAAFTKKRQAKNKAIETGLQSLLRAEIIRSYEKYTERNYAPIYAKEAVKRMYESYHELGGNDVATDLYKKIMALPTEPKEEV